MNREDIIRMAQEAGLTDESFERDWYVFQLERFATLVAAAAKAEENEACAKVCESRQTPGTASVAILNGAVDAIRARGQA